MKNCDRTIVSKNRNLLQIEVWTTLLLSILAIWQNQVTVFYMIYLFWWQEFLRTIVDVLLGSYRGEQSRKGMVLGSFFILFIYLVFIVVIFGLVLAFRHKEHFILNANIMFFKNWWFNSNLLLFLIEYIFYRNVQHKGEVTIQVFNPRHIILHISIILGAFVQMLLVPKLALNPTLSSLLVISPFLLLKFFLGRK